MLCLIHVCALCLAQCLADNNCSINVYYTELASSNIPSIANVLSPRPLDVTLDAQMWLEFNTAKKVLNSFWPFNKDKMSLLNYESGHGHLFSST